MALPVVTDLADIYRLADTGAIVSLFSRLGRIKGLLDLCSSSDIIGDRYVCFYLIQFCHICSN